MEIIAAEEKLLWKTTKMALFNFLKNLNVAIDIMWLCFTNTLYIIIGYGL